MFKKAASLLLAASLLATTSLPAFAEEVTEPLQSETTVQETQEETPAPTDVPDTTPEPEVEVTPEPTEEPTPAPTAEPESTPEPVQEEPEAVQAETPTPTETPIPLEEITDSQDVVTYEMTGETVSRIEWVADIVSALGLSVDADQFPDDYYPDVTATDEHYQALMSAVANGLIDLDAGENFHPDDPTTREFAANTLNSRLGYIMQAESYSFTDSVDTAYADDLQVAVEQGWFALVDGKVLPQQAADAAELTAMQEKGKAAVANESIDTNYASSWTFAEDVVVIPGGTMVSVDENDIVTITDCPVSLAAGQRFVAYFSGIPVPFKAVSVTENGSDTVVATTDEGTDDAITSADSETVIEVDPSNFVPAEATTYMIGDVQVVEEKTLYGIDYNKQTKTLTATRNLKLDGATGGSITIQLSNITLDSRARPNNSQIIVNADTSVTGTVNFGGELMQKIERDIDFGYIDLAGGIGKIYLSLGYTLSGDVSLNMVGRAKAGFVSDNSGFRVVSDYRNDSSSIAANMDATAGLRIGASAGIPGVKGDIYARMGLELQEAIRTYSSGTPTTCENTNAWLYADASATAKVFGKSYSKNCAIYTRTNSPVRCAYHYEDGVSVQKCTRGNTSQGYTGSASGYNGKYYTSTTSKNYNPTGSSYQDEMGQTQSRFTYTLDDDGNATITGCNNITSSLVIPSEIDGHTVVAIGSQAFYKAANLASVSIPNSVTYIGSEAFNGCTKLASVNLPANLETLKRCAFQNCTALTEINIPASLNVASYPFEGCSNLKTIHFEDGITQITNYLFGNCTGLTDIEIPDTVTTIGSYAFSSATNLASVSIPDSVTTINSGAFANCTKLTAVEIPDSVTYIGSEAFKGCTKLASVSLSANLETLKSDAFQNCTALTEINIPASLNEASYPFEGCSNLKTIHFEDGITQITNYLFAGCTGLTDIEIPDTVTTIGYQAFYKAANLASVSIPDSVTTINNEAFEYCTKLTSVEIPDSVTYIGSEAFKGCTKLASVKLPANLKTLKFDVFMNCSSLTEITIPASITALPSNTFNGCTSLAKVTLPDTLTSIGSEAFEKCDALTTVTIPASVAEIGGYAFSGCNRLVEVSLSDGLKSIDDKAFYNCVSLKSITIPRTVTSLGTGAFSGDKVLAEVTLGTGLTSIPTECFYQSPALTKIRIPNRVTQIGDRAFANCTKLTEVTLPAATTSISSSAFSYPARMTIYGYEGSYAQTFAASKKIKFVARTDVDYIDVNDLTITLGTVDSYRGSPVEPTVTVKDGSVTLTKDTHYTLTYANSNTVGMASVTITGLNEAGYGSTKTIEYRIPGFTMTFNANGGTVNPTSKEIIYGQPVGELPVPVRDGYSFVGWYLGNTHYTEDTIYTSTYGCTVYARWSDAAAITRQPVNTAAKENANAVFTIKATGSNLTYQWQLAYAGSDNWQNVPASFAGGKTDTLTVTATKGRNGYKFRCIVKDDKNNSVTSSAATLTVEAANQPLKILSLTADKAAADSGDRITITANVTGGAGGYTYKFIINDTTNDSWYKLQDYKGTNSIVWKATSAGTKRIMVDVKDKAGNKVATNISIKVNGTVSVPLSAELKSSAVTVKQGETVTLTAVAKGGSGKYNYKFIINDKTDDKWYRLQDFGANNVITWKATTPGTKRLMVDVMDSTGKKIGHNITITVTK